MGADSVNAPIPASLALFVDRVRTAIDELHAAQTRLVSLKKIPRDTTHAQEDAMLERERALGAMNALEFEIAPALAALDLQAVANQIYESGRVQTRDHFIVHGVGSMRSGDRMQIVSRPPDQHAFLISELRFAHVDWWFVHDLRIGRRSQDLYGSAALFHGVPLKLEPMQTAMDLELEVEYIGPDTDRRVSFEMIALGISASSEQRNEPPPAPIPLNGLSDDEQERMLEILRGLGTPTAEVAGPAMIDPNEAVRRASDLIAADAVIHSIDNNLTLSVDETRALIRQLRNLSDRERARVDAALRDFDDNDSPEPTE